MLLQGEALAVLACPSAQLPLSQSGSFRGKRLSITALDNGNEGPAWLYPSAGPHTTGMQYPFPLFYSI